MTDGSGVMMLPLHVADPGFKPRTSYGPCEHRARRNYEHHQCGHQCDPNILSHPKKRFEESVRPLGYAYGFKTWTEIPCNCF